MTFQDLNLNTPLLNALDDMGHEQPTAIQSEVFPVAMSGKDLFGIAQTGTGKTIAYLLPCLRKWTFTKEKSPQFLILVPTRELVIQVVEVAKALAAYTSIRVSGIYGGVNMIRQMDVVTEGCDVLVATPGRLLDFIFKGSIRMKSIKVLVIDEVDEMLNLGFRHQLVNILDLLPPKRQNLLFSATLTEDIEVLALQYFNQPVNLTTSAGPLAQIRQQGYDVPNFNTKINLLEHLLRLHSEMRKVLVFATTKKMADQIYDQMVLRLDDPVGVMHSNKAQQNRFNTVQHFQDGDIRVLIATDIVARGIDVSFVSHVINFELPELPEQYIHRIGRTGRADQHGVAICFITEAEKEKQQAIEDLMQMSIPMSPLPDDLEISAVLTRDEMPVINMKSVKVKLPKAGESGGAFHEKKDKNKKVNNPIRKKDKMKLKYKKPKTRGQKKKGD
jgi:ATP-dependent RNA helicase RhlE